MGSGAVCAAKEGLVVIEVSYHDTADKLQDLAFAASGPFDSLRWLSLLERHGASPMIALARDGSEWLALPMVRKDGALISLTNWFGFIWSPLTPHSQPSLALMQAVARDLLKREAHLVFNKIPEERGLADQMEQSFRDAGWTVFRNVSDQNHVLDVRGRSYAEYHAARPGRLRTTLSRKSKKVETEIFTEFQSSIWETYRSIYDKSWKPDEELSALLEDFAREEGAGGRLRMGIATADGTPVAAQFWSVEDGTAYIHKLAHVPEYEKLSAGTVLTAALFRHVIDVDGVELVDFGTGDDSYKRDWMEILRLRYTLDCYNPRKPQIWPAMGKAWLRHLAQSDRHS